MPIFGRGNNSMSSTFGTLFKITTFGESHGPAIGVIVDGVPPNLHIPVSAIQHDLDRRRPGTSPFVSPRKETDRVEILSGLTDERSLGTPIAMVIASTGARSRDYSALADLFRPSHADYTYYKKYGIPPQPGGGRASGRETAARVAGGAVARQFLQTAGITIQSCTTQIGSVTAQRMDSAFAETDPLRCADPDAAEAMAAEVMAAQDDGDSIGGLIEITVTGVPAGLGEPVFNKLDAALGSAMLSIGAVKGVAFGAGFAVAASRGSETNDEMNSDGFCSNNAGGILGGISTGQPIGFRLAVKPPASIAREQQTINLEGDTRSISITGRHDPCLCPRIGPVAEAMTALVLADALMLQTSRRRKF